VLGCAALLLPGALLPSGCRLVGPASLLNRRSVLRAMNSWLSKRKHSFGSTPPSPPTTCA
jgi:hypothetical protein